MQLNYKKYFRPNKLVISLFAITIISLSSLFSIVKASTDRFDKLCNTPNRSDLIIQFCTLKDKVVELESIAEYLKTCRGDYIDNQNGTITDNCSSLQWQKTSTPSLHTWEDATQYCTNSSLGGYNDWRLPTEEELVTLMKFTSDPKIYSPFSFGETEWLNYYNWSSSEDPPFRAWVVAFHTGSTGSIQRWELLSTRCVRN